MPFLKAQLQHNISRLFHEFRLTFCISQRPRVMSTYLFCLNINETPNLFTSNFLLPEAPYYVTIATVIFSQVKITFHVKRYHVSTQKVTWHITVLLGLYACLLTRETNSNYLYMYLNLVSSKCNYCSAN